MERMACRAPTGRDYAALKRSTEGCRRLLYLSGRHKDVVRQLSRHSALHVPQAPFLELLSTWLSVWWTWEASRSRGCPQLDISLRAASITPALDIHEPVPSWADRMDGWIAGPITGRRQKHGLSFLWCTGIALAIINTEHNTTVNED